MDKYAALYANGSISKAGFSTQGTSRDQILTKLEEVIRNNLIVDEGDAYNKILHAKSINNLKNLNFFRDVSSKVVDGTSQNKKIINISVEEKPTGEITAGAGVGTDLSAHNEIDMISFTGSTRAGKLISKNAWFWINTTFGTMDSLYDNLLFDAI